MQRRQPDAIEIERPWPLVEQHARPGVGRRPTPDRRPGLAYNHRHTRVGNAIRGRQPSKAAADHDNVNVNGLGRSHSTHECLPRSIANVSKNLGLCFGSARVARRLRHFPTHEPQER